MGKDEKVGRTRKKDPGITGFRGDQKIEFDTPNAFSLTYGTRFSISLTR